MSRRIFVNIQNSVFDTVTKNRKGGQFGLGVPSQLSDQERSALGQQGNEIYFTTTDLLEKKRKIQIIFDSFTDSKFFGDGSVKIDKVQNYVTELELQGQQQRTAASADAARFISTTAGIAGAQVLTIGAITGGSVAGGSAVIGAAIGTALALPLAAAIGVLSPVFSAVKSNIQAGREDNAAPWKMTRADFPKLTGQARADGDNKRSIERLYDDRQLIGGRNRSTKYAIARLTREALADALFSRVPTGGTVSIAVPEHPLNDDNEALAQARHFPFRELTEGPDQTERTYVNAVLYLKSYIDLIDTIINLRNQTLSRSPDKDQVQKILELNIKLSTAQVPLFTAMQNAVTEVVREKVLTFFDKNREYKTLLNFGNDRQYLAEAWRLTPANTGSVQFKLTRPLDTDIAVEQFAFVSRELAKSVVDIIEFDLSPLQDNTPYLRPFNIDERNIVNSKMFATNVTLTSLDLATGSVGSVINGTSISYEDAVFRRWFTGDFKSSELNIDFGDYNKFVHFGSAYARLEAFTEKLKKIEQLTSASVSSSVSSSIVSLKIKAQEKENIIRNFDPYEQFLYYANQDIPYSASAFYTDNEIEYHAIGSWPKQSNGSVYSPYSTIASSWLTTQLGIAQRYDENNPNYISLNIPRHIREDLESAEFVQLLNMAGHLMDNIKVYIDQFSNIYSTNPDPLKELTMDQVYEVAQSFGLKLPNVYALNSLQTFNAQFTGDSGSRSYAAEVWKRFLHSMIYFVKTKGSRTSFDALLNAYGINSPILQIKETTYPSPNNYIQSDELTYGLLFTQNVSSSIQLPFVSSSITASTVQLRFNPIIRQTSSLLTADTWALDLIPHPSQSKTEYGRIHVVSGSSRTIIASSSYFPLFSNDYTNIMLRSQSTDITIIQTDGDQILFQESTSLNLESLWNNTVHLNVGGSGSLKLSSNFDGIIDEVRIWGENISANDFVAQAYDPGSYYGSSYTSSYQNLYVHIAFSQPLPSITSSATNESPYQNLSIVSNLPTAGFTTTSYSRITRQIKQFTPIVGSTIYTNKKIMVADPPTFDSRFVDVNGTKILSSKSSIKQIEEKQYNSGQNVVSFAVSPTDFINQNIMRSMGVVDVNNIIGSPRYITGSGYSTLQEIQKDYMQYFNKAVNPNQYIRFFKDLIQGPVEMANEMTPARAKLIDGIVIESSVLSRNREIGLHKFAVDGTDTKTFNAFVSGSGSAGVGAYQFDKLVEEVSLLPVTMGDILPLEGIISISASVDMRESTRPNKLPSARRVTQQINNSYASGKFATSSFLDDNSSYVTLEAPSIVAIPVADQTSSGYPRNAYVGTTVIPTENNTLVPFYSIEPRSDLTEVGTSTYFHKLSGIYEYDIFTKYKTDYLVKLDTQVTSPLDRLYAKITLLPFTSTLNSPGRKTTKIPVQQYTAGKYTAGVITMDNIFSLYHIGGLSVTGLRLRLYRSETDRNADSNRPFSTIPSSKAGVLFDGILSNGLVFPYTLIQTDSGLLYYSVDNTTSTTIESDINLTHFTYEPTNLVPRGYLPRHYKFSRDNTTPLKRRNYIGCKSVSTTFGSESPIIITVSKLNTVVVNTQSTIPFSGSEPIILPEENGGLEFGGGGPLNVE
jgi:hypothetical protein